MRKVIALALALILGTAASAAASGINVFVGVPAIVNGGAAAVAMYGGGDISSPVVVGGGGGSGLANLWVDTSGGSCTRQATAGAYVDSQACGSFNAAYVAANAGDEVLVKGNTGSYGAQLINGTGKSSGSNVVIEAAPGETVTLTGELGLTAKRITIRNMNLGNNNLYMGPCCSDGNALDNQQIPEYFEVDNVNARDLRLFSARHVLVKNSDFGPSSSCGGAYGGENSKVDSFNISQGVAGTVTPSDIVLQNNTFHDIQTWSINGDTDPEPDTGGDCHIECLAVFTTHDLILRGNTFYNCAIFDVFVKQNSASLSGDGYTGAFRFESNTFASCHNFHISPQTCSTLAFCTHPADTRIVNNTFQGQPSLQDCTQSSWPGTVMQGNYGVQQFNVCSFATGVTYSYNAWTNQSACSGTGNLGNVANDFVSNATDTEFNHNSNLHLAGNVSSLLGVIPAASSGLTLPIDMDGGTRIDPFDIGADEYGVGPEPTPTPTPTPTSTPSGAQRFVSTTGADSGNCSSSSSPCATMGYAYQQAAQGDVVEMAAGTYTGTGQNIPADASKTTNNDVTFRPASGVTVNIAGANSPSCSPTNAACWYINGDHVTLEGLNFTRSCLGDECESVYVRPSANDVTFLNDTIGRFEMTATGSSSATAPSDISFIGGQIGPWQDGQSRIDTDGSNGSAVSTNVLIDGVSFESYVLSNPGSSSPPHVEQLQVWAVNGLTIRNSTFASGEAYNIFIHQLPGNLNTPKPTNVLIENNFFRCCVNNGANSGYFMIEFANHAGTGTWTNITVRNNSFYNLYRATSVVIPLHYNDNGGNPGTAATFSNVVVRGNVGPPLQAGDGNPWDPPGSIPSGISDYNVWTSAGVSGLGGAHDVVGASSYIDGPNGNLHLSSGSATAVSHADPTNYPATDIDGATRDGSPDAGADEYGAP